MDMPSYVEVPRPISSRSTREREERLCSIMDVSSISTMKVDSPREMLSEAPTLVKSLSQYPIRASDAGTKEPICAISTIRAVCLRSADLPAMFGPVRIMICCDLLSSMISLGTNSSPAGMRVSITGCRPARMSILVLSFTSGRQ